MDILSGLVALTDHIAIQHVLVLNLLGVGIKSVLHQRGLDNWTDIIPLILLVLGIVLAFADPTKYSGHFIVYGMANAGCAWLLHQGTKIPAAIKKKFNGKKA